MQTVAPSTIAFTLYNLIALAGRQITEAELAKRLEKHHPGVAPDEVNAALKELVERGLVDSLEVGYDLRDKQRRVARSRQRADPDGWRGWMVQDRRVGLISIETAIGES